MMAAGRIDNGFFRENCGIAEISEFSTLTQNGLIKIGITCRNDLELLHPKDLYKIDYIGKVGRQSIIKYFRDQGLRFNCNSYFPSPVPVYQQNNKAGGASCKLQSIK